jgi:hypothetical protein
MALSLSPHSGTNVINSATISHHPTDHGREKSPFLFVQTWRFEKELLLLNEQENNPKRSRQKGHSQLNQL